MAIAAEVVAERVIEAYEETGWEPVAYAIGGFQDGPGCALGVVARQRFNEITGVDRLQKAAEYLEVGNWLMFACAFDSGMKGREQEEDFLDSVGYQVGCIIRDWWEIKQLDESKKHRELMPSGKAE